MSLGLLAALTLGIVLLVWLRRSGLARAGATTSGVAVATSHSPASPPLAQYVINNPTGAGVVPAALLPGTGRGYFMQIVGESHYQVALTGLRAGADKSGEVSVILAAEPDNAYDHNAVVVKTFKNDTIGYLAREDAARYQPTLLELNARGLVSICSAKLYGGKGDKPSFGVWLDLDPPTAVAAHFGIKYVRQRHKNSVV